MHRTKTHFSARVHRVARAIEKRGVRATYRLHDQVLSNRSSRRHFSGARPELDDVQRRIVADLETDGYSLLTFSELFDDDTWPSVEKQAADFVSATEAGLAGDGGELKVREGKEFVVRLMSYGVDVDLTSPWFRRQRRRTGCSTSRTPTSASGRSSSTSTCGTRCLSPRRPIECRPSAGIETSTTSTC